MEHKETTCCHCNKTTYGENFCVTCEKNGYHHCEECNTVINTSVFTRNKLICHSCLEKSDL